MMKDFTIPENRNTPGVKYTSSLNSLEISGKSYPENARKFYDELMNRFNAHTFPAAFTITIDLDYMSSASVIGVMELLKRFKSAAAGTVFTVRFCTDKGDDDMLAIGENYQKITGMPFEFIEK